MEGGQHSQQQRGNLKNKKKENPDHIISWLESFVFSLWLYIQPRLQRVEHQVWRTRLCWDCLDDDVALLAAEDKHKYKKRRQWAAYRERSESWMEKTNEMKPSKKNGGEGSKESTETSSVPCSSLVLWMCSWNFVLCVHSSIQHVRREKN